MTAQCLTFQQPSLHSGKLRWPHFLAPIYSLISLLTTSQIYILTTSVSNARHICFIAGRRDLLAFEAHCSSMADLNRLSFTTLQPDTRPSMQGSQGQKPRKQKKNSEREQAELTGAERVQAAHDQKLRDMLHRQQAGKQNLQLQQAGEQAPNLDAEMLGAVGSIKAGPSSSGDAALTETALKRLGDPLSLEGAVRAEESAQEMDRSPEAPQDIVPSIEVAASEDPNLIDCTKAPRAYTRIIGVRFPIWKPSDGDNIDTGTGDIYGALMPPLSERWKVFQSDIGPYDWKTGNIPPKYTRLDDQAAALVLKSNIPAPQMALLWPHDFTPGYIRRARAHVGRPSISNPKAEGRDKYESTIPGGKAKHIQPYLFIGGPNYQPTYYRPIPKAPDPKLADLSEAAREKRRMDAYLDSIEEPNRRAHGHNQYTPKDMMVKHGAPSGAKPVVKTHNLPPIPKPNHHLKSFYNPIHTEYRLVGGIAESARESVRDEKKKKIKEALAQSSIEDLQAELTTRKRPLDSDNEDNDDHCPAKRAKGQFPIPNRLLPAPLAKPAAAAEINHVVREHVNIPRTLGMLNRIDLEKRIATQVLEKNPSKQALADELARDQIKVEQGRKEIELLRKQLKEAEEARGEDDNEPF